MIVVSDATPIISLSAVNIDLQWLGRQREALGEERFRAILKEQFGEEGAGVVWRMVNEYGKKSK